MKKNITWCLFIFIVVFLVYISSPIITSGDSRWSVHTSLSILKEGNTSLNEYKKAHEGHHAIESVNGDLYTIFPIGGSLLALPFVAIADMVFTPFMETFPAIRNFFISVLAQNGIIVDQLKLIDLYLPIELIIASFLCAITAVIIFLIARMHVSISSALIIVFIFSFCTSSWSVSSRALWQHGPSMLMLSITLYLILLEDSIKGIIKYTAIPLALAFIIRPTNAIPIVFFSGYIFLNYRKQFLQYLLIALPFAGVFFIYNLSIYDSILSPYYLPERVFRLNSFFEALAGNLISPARGIFIYSPILLLPIGLIFSKQSKPKINSLSVLLLLILLCHWIVISSFPHWWAGESYGPRFFADMIPFFIYFIILFMMDFEKNSSNKTILTLIVILPLILISFYINAKGAYFWDVHQWNLTPNNIDTHPERLWDWHDLSFLR